MRKIITLAIFAMLTAASARAARAATLSIDKPPVPTTFPTNSNAASYSSVRDWVNSAGANYTYTGDDGTVEKGKVTADMCYLSADVDSETLSEKTGSFTNSQTIYVIYKNASHTYSFTQSPISKVVWPDNIGTSEYLAGVHWDVSGASIRYTCRNGYSGSVKVNTDMLYLADTVKEYTGYYGNGDVIDRKNKTYSKDNWINKPANYRVVLVWNGYCSAHEFKQSVYTAASTKISPDVAPKFTADYATEPAASSNRKTDFKYEINSFKNLKVWDIVKDKYTKTGYSSSEYEAAAGKLSAPDRVSTNACKYYDVTVLSRSEGMPEIQYRAHVQNIGWQGYEYSPDTAGTEGRSLRMEALQINIANQKNVLGSIVYSSHVQISGDQPEVSMGKTTGTVGKGRRLEGIRIKLTGQYAKVYDIMYRVHVQKRGWMEWNSNGEYAGTKGESLRVEAVQIKTRLKG